MKQSLSVFILSLLISFIYSDLYAEAEHLIKPDFSKESIRSINETPGKFGNYNVDAYVVFIYQCLPCPEDAQCKPCMRDNIVISEENKKLTGYYLNSSDLVIYTSNSHDFALSQYYKFSITVEEDQARQNPKEAKLIGFEPISSKNQ